MKIDVLKELTKLLESLEGKSEEEVNATLERESKKVLKRSVDLTDEEIDQVYDLLADPDSHPQKLRAYVLKQLIIAGMLDAVHPEHRIPHDVILTWCMMAYVRCGVDNLPESLPEFMSELYL